MNCLKKHNDSCSPSFPLKAVVSYFLAHATLFLFNSVLVESNGGLVLTVLMGAGLSLRPLVKLKHENCETQSEHNPIQTMDAIKNRLDQL